MSEPQSPSTGPTWLNRGVILLLALQVGLLWTHGSMLQRQHDDIQGLRDDVQSLAESLDQEDGWDSSEGDTHPHPARTLVRHGRRLIRASAPRTGAEPQAQDPQAGLALEENARQAEEAARIRADDRWRPWLWTIPAAGLAALLGRSWLRRRA